MVQVPVAVPLVAEVPVKVTGQEAVADEVVEVSVRVAVPDGAGEEYQLCAAGLVTVTVKGPSGVLSGFEPEEVTWTFGVPWVTLSRSDPAGADAPARFESP